MKHDAQQIIEMTNQRFKEFYHMDIPTEGYDVVRPTEASILMCARLVHVAVEALNTAHNEYMVPWEVNKASIIAGVKRTLANPNETAEQNHNAWHEYKRQEGWVYGPLKDPVKKTHPCMVPYAALGPHHQSKDAIFQAIVREFFGLTRPMVEPQSLVEEDADLTGKSVEQLQKEDPELYLPKDGPEGANKVNEPPEVDMAGVGLTDPE